jgi:signal transduction histidine kinase
MFGLENLDLLSVGVAVAAVAILGVIIYLSDRNSSTNKSFLFFSVVTILWGVCNYISYNTDSPVFILWSFRLVMFFAVFHAFSLFQLFYVFPAAKAVYPKYYKFLVIPTVIVTAGLTLTPFVFSKLAEISSTGSVSKTVVEKGIVVFGVTVISLILSAIGILIKKILVADSEERRRFWPILLGTIGTFSLLIIFNFILPGVFLYVRFIPLGAVFILPFAFSTFYAIYKHRLFHVKVLAASLLVFALTILTFSEVILAGNNVSLIIYRSSVFILVLVFGILLIRGVLREVEQREKLQVLTEELSVANEKLKQLDRAKTEFVSIASHQLRAPLTAIKGYASLLLEGSFGPMTDKVHGAIDIIFQSSQRLVQLIEDFLNISPLFRCCSNISKIII